MEVATVNWECLGEMAGELATPDVQGSSLELPTGYYVERDPDVLILRRLDGSMVGVFSPRGVDPKAVLGAIEENGPQVPSANRNTAPVEVGAYLPIEVVDEAMHFLVRNGPVEVAILVRYITIERRNRRVDQPGHGEPFFTRPDCMMPRL